MKNTFIEGNPYLRMVMNLFRAGSIIDRRISDALKIFGITHIQFNLLLVLEAAYPNPISAGQLIKQMLFSTSDLTRLIDRLVTKGFVSRIAAQKDRRRMEITITVKGLETIEKALSLMEKEIIGYYKNHISEKERDMMLKILEKLEE